MLESVQRIITHRLLPSNMSKTIDVPERVRITALLRGENGRAWIDGLPQQIDGIEQRWNIVVGEAFGRATEALVANARTQDGVDVVLKIAVPGIDPNRQELRTLRAANGRGYAKLLRCDEDANILLLERLGVQLHEVGYGPERQMEIICATLNLAWLDAPEGRHFATGAGKARQLWEMIETRWTRLGKPCAEQTFDYGARCARQRAKAFAPERSVLVHGDAHEWNTLAARDSPTGFKFVDPDGAFAERAFDLAVPMREWGAVTPDGNPLDLGIARCRQLSTLTSVDPGPIWQWSILQCLSNGLLLLEEGFDGAARVSLAMADAWTKGRDWING